jgi:hypothetical protein
VTGALLDALLRLLRLDFGYALGGVHGAYRTKFCAK